MVTPVLDSLPFTLINGDATIRLDPTDRGLAYGDGLFETMRYCAGSIPFWPWHWRRLQQGCTRLRLPLSNELIYAQRDEILRALTRLAIPQATLKLIVTRGSGGRGYYPPDPQHTHPTLIWHCRPMPLETPESDPALHGVALHPAAVRLAPDDILAGIKHLNRLPYVLAAEDVPQGHEGLLLSSEGHVLEAVHHNIFWRSGAGWFTPSLQRHGVHGVLRQWLLDRQQQLAITFQLVEAGLDAVLNADEVFIGNSVRGIWPVRSLAQRTWVPGDATRRLQQQLAQVWAGVDDA